MASKSKKCSDLEARQFRKTKMCMFNEKGCCRYAQECPFAHSPEELEEMPDLKKTSICKNWQRGTCPLSPEECSYAHGKEELRKSPLSSLPRGGSKALEFKHSSSSFSSSSDTASTSEGFGSPFGRTDTERTSRSSTKHSDDDSFLQPQLSWDPLGLGDHQESKSSVWSCLTAQLADMELQGQKKRSSRKKTTRPDAAFAMQSVNMPEMCGFTGLGLNNSMVNALSMGQIVMFPTATVMWDELSHQGMDMKMNGYYDYHMESALKQAMPTHYED